MQVNDIIRATVSNIDLLMDQNYGAILCYQDPDTCTDSGRYLISELKLINRTALENIMRVTNYKYTISPCLATYYRLGDGLSMADWHV
jgi:hypothetical protein